MRAYNDYYSQGAAAGPNLCVVFSKVSLEKCNQGKSIPGRGCGDFAIIMFETSRVNCT